MPRAVFFSDLHLEAGAALGWPDVEYGNTRLRDAEEVLDQIAQDECDVLVFAGDLGRTAKLGATAYRIAQDFFKKAKAKNRILLAGNHDYTGTRDTALHVIANSMDRAVLLDRPQVVKASGIQIAGIPWAPPSRLFDKAKHNPREMNKLMGERLLAIAQGLGQKIDSSKPSVLVIHWLVSGTALQTGSSVIETSEPILSSDDLAGSGPWDMVLAGHNHRFQEANEKVWVIGSPTKTSFGEQGLPTGYVRIDWEQPSSQEDQKVVQYIRTKDRPLMTLALEADGVAGWLNWIGGMGGEGISGITPDAVVRLRYSCTEEQARKMSQGGARRLVQAIYDAGASKVIGPQVTVGRETLRRSDMTTELAPGLALRRWTEAQELGKDEQSRVVRMGDAIIEGSLG